MPSNPDIRNLPAIGFLFLLALIWFLPFCMPFHGYPVGTFWQEWMVAMLLGMTIIWILFQAPDRSTFHLPKIILVPIGLVLVIGLQFILGQYSFAAQLTVPLVYLGLAALAFCLGKTLAERNMLEAAGQWIAVACLLGGLFSVAVQMAQLSGIEGRFAFMSRRVGGDGLYANINQANHLAAYLAMSLAAALYCRVKSQLGVITYWIASIFLLAGLVLTGQRCAQIFVLMPLLSTLVVWRSQKLQREMLLRSSVILVALFVSLYFLLRPLLEGTGAHLYQSPSLVVQDPRWAVWSHAWMMFKSHPWLGVGFSQFGSVYFGQLDLIGGDQFYTNAHNVFAALLAETGGIGILLLVIPVLAWVWRARLQSSSTAQWLGWTQLLIIGAHSMIEFPLWYVYWLIIVAFWLGALDPESWKLVVKAPRIAVAVFLLIFAIPLMDTAFTYQKLVFTAFGSGPLGDTEQERFRQYRADMVIAESKHWFFQREGSYQLAANMLEISPDHAAEKIVFNEKVMKAMPGPILISHQVVLYVFAGDMENAVRWLARAHKVYSSQYQQIVDDVVAYAVKWPQHFSPAVIERLRATPSSE